MIIVHLNHQLYRNVPLKTATATTNRFAPINMTRVYFRVAGRDGTDVIISVIRIIDQ